MRQTEKDVYMMKLLCLAACESERAGGKRRLCKICFHPGALQSDLPGGGTGDGKAVCGGQHSHDTLQRTGRRAFVEGPRRDFKRLEEDSYAKLKYDTTAEQDGVVIGRVMELAAKHGVSMTEVSLAWLLTKVTAPVVGATKMHHIEGAAKAVDLILSEEETAYLEEPYVPHALVGVMAQNTISAAKEKHVWSTGNQKI